MTMQFLTLLVFRWLITTLLWVFFWIPIYLLGFLVTWLGLLFCSKNSEHFPILWWFWDNSHGINGTLNGNNPKWVFICNPILQRCDPAQQKSIYNSILLTKTGLERTFKNRWVWTTWRNPVSNLSLYPMGKKITTVVNTKTYNILFLSIQKVTSKGGWFYSFTIPYNNVRCFYYAFGWKYLDPAEDRARFIYRISPYREIPK